MKESNIIISKYDNKPLKSSIKTDAIAGAFAGFFARLITAPFDFIKIRIQLQSVDNRKYTNIFQTFRTITKEEGFLALWKGNISATYLWISYAMVQFTVYGFLKRFSDNLASNVEKSPDNITNNNEVRSKSFNWRPLLLFTAGAIAGISATVSTYPFDIMRTQFVLQGNLKTYPSMYSFIGHTWKTQGIGGFFAGITPAVIGIAPYMGLNFALYEAFTILTSYPKEILEDNSKLKQTLSTVLNHGVCGALAGGTSKFIVYPLDTVKKRLQAQALTSTIDGLLSIPKYKGFLHCTHTILKQEGIKGFYRGIVPTTLKSFVATAATFAAFESAKDILESYKLNDKNNNKHE